MRTTRKTLHAVRKAFLAATLTVATGGVLALGGGGVVRVAANDNPTNAPAKSATSMRAENATEAVSDSAITTTIKTKLLLSMKDLKSTEDVHVKTRDGIVNVSGTVPSKQQHDVALETIRSVDGVRSIHDSLKVSSR
ncbi:BON domain-containing protein [Cupriavidus sp. BIS7]|uniref:BON domain-containing protein n=1 Tax=Cupriavidus sp. BIS7 TaxID=1217718 RepID=UPI00030F40CD|nr:BON domain-containing protein [Cupriavidus sp. BIS7]